MHGETLKFNRNKVIQNEDLHVQRTNQKAALFFFHKFKSYFSVHFTKWSTDSWAYYIC